MVYKYIMLIAAFVIGGAWAQSEIENATESVTSIPTTAKEVSSPQELQNHIFQEMKTMCEQNGANSYQNMEIIFRHVSNCIKSVNNMSGFQQEIEKAKPVGKLDEVFKKYCEMKPKIVSCVSNSIECSKGCLSSEHFNQLNIAYDVFQNLVDFICYKEGDRIALFIAENGITCLKRKEPELGQCMRKIIELDYRFQMNNFFDLLAFDKEECDNVSELQKCMYSVFETCPTPTVANIFHSLYKYIRQVTPCSKFPDPNITDSASSMYVTLATLIMAASTALIF